MEPSTFRISSMLKETRPSESGNQLKESMLQILSRSMKDKSLGSLFDGKMTVRFRGKSSQS